MTEDIITVLSKLPGLLVISRNSTFRFKAQEIEPVSIGKQLGTKYLLTGSVRRSGGNVRINVQLIDAQSGGYMWADRYDGEISDVLTLQDDVAKRVADALALNLSGAVRAVARSGETGNTKAYDLFLRGWEHYRKRSPEQQVRALDFFKQAVAIDPSYARAHAAIASVYWTSFRGQWLGSVIPEEPDMYGRRDKAYEHLDRAMVNPTPLAFQVRARMNLYRGHHHAALSDARDAVRLDGNDADALTTLAEVLILYGRPQEADAPIQQARRLDPYNRSYHSFLQGFARFGRSEFAEAIADLERALDLGPEEWELETGWRAFQPGRAGAQAAPAPPLYTLPAASYAYLNRQGDTGRIVLAIKEKWPAVNIKTELYYWLYRNDEDRGRLADGLRRAGLPES